MGGDDAVAASPLQLATTRPPKAQGRVHIAQPHEQPQQQHSRRPLSVGVAAALAMRAPLCCVRPPTEFGVILGRFDKIPFTAVLRRKSPRFSQPAPIAREPGGPAFGEPPFPNWRPRDFLLPLPSNNPPTVEPLFSPDDDSKFEPALQEK